MEYVANWRMALAKQLLLGRQISISEIARRVGYASTIAFSVAFNRHVGVTPGAFAAQSTAQRESH
jgi:AraC-like DNA-binding protein